MMRNFRKAGGDTANASFHFRVVRDPDGEGTMEIVHVIVVAQVADVTERAMLGDLAMIGLLYQLVLDKPSDHGQAYTSLVAMGRGQLLGGANGPSTMETLMRLRRISWDHTPPPMPRGTLARGGLRSLGAGPSPRAPVPSQAAPMPGGTRCPECGQTSCDPDCPSLR